MSENKLMFFNIFVPLITNTMRNLLKCFAVIATVIVLTSTSASAATVTLHFNINLTNTCDPGYKGYYCVQLKVYFDGHLEGTSTNCKIDQSGCWSFDFDIPEVSSLSLYSVELVAAGESGGGCAQMFNTNAVSNIPWSLMLSCSTAPIVPVNL